MPDFPPMSRRSLLAGSAALASGLTFAQSPFGAPAVQERRPPAASDRQILRLGTSSAPSRLSMAGYGGFLVQLGTLLYQPPFRADAQGTLVPGVCTDWSVSADNLRYTFTLDPAARFSDGSKITAEDMKYSFEYMAMPESGNPFPYYQTQAVVGHDAVRRGETREMSGLAVIDDETLQITLARPFSPFLAYCSQMLNGIYQRRNIEEGGAEWDSRPTVSSGPYVVESWDRDTGATVLVPNPFWWREQSPITRLEIIVAPDVNTLSVLWSNDEIDFWVRPLELAAQYETGPERDFLVPTPSPYLYFLCCRTTVPPMDDINVRRALLLATDVETIVPALFEGSFLPANSLSSPAIPGYEPKPPFFDPDAARAALAASSYGGAENLPPVVFGVAAGTSLSVSAQAIQQSWRDVLGIEPAVLPSDPGFDPSEIGANVFFRVPGPMFVDAGGFITWALKSDNSVFQETVQIQDPDVDALIEQAEALAATDLAGRTALYDQASDLMVQRGYLIPYCYGPITYLVKPWVANAAFRPDTSPIIEPMFIAER